MKIIGVFFSLLATIGIGLTLPSWALMLLIGDVHRWWPIVPTMGFGTAIPLAILIRVVFLPADVKVKGQ